MSIDALTLFSLSILITINEPHRPSLRHPYSITI